MAIYPVIMCGGSGTRLWPSSRTARPKQFVPLCGETSSFLQAVVRLVGLRGAGSPVIVAGRGHADAVAEQLAAAGVEADVLLEPMARDSAAAMAAAAAWVAQHDPAGVMVVCASDHHIPDNAAFRDAVAVAAEAAAGGAIVTLGVRPTEPSTAYGYIRSADGETGGVRAVAAFVEKPDQATAARYIAEGYFWNSGNFVVAARTLLEELDAYAPEVSAAARDAVAAGAKVDGHVLLGADFAKAPKISIDYAVMERTAKAAILPVDFAWSDLGAWNAVHAASPADADGNVADEGVFLHQTEGCLVRSGTSQTIALVGVSDIAVVVEGDAVLVCGLEASQSIKAVVERLPAELTAGAPPGCAATLADLAVDLRAWLMTEALPLWWALGADHDRGGFVEALDVDGSPLALDRRARVNGRQTYVFATAGLLGWAGPWRQACRHGLQGARADYQRDDGLFRALVTADGKVVDDTVRLYDQAFFLLGGAAAQEALQDGARLEDDALTLLDALEARRHPAGGFVEAGDQPYLSNPHMHLFEASLAWERAGKSPRWPALADDLAALAMDKLIDGATGAIAEIYDAAWRPSKAEGEGRLEPGHQFEWAWLITRWGTARGSERALKAARALYEAGSRGVDGARGVATNAMAEDFSIADAGARLWPQTEWLKAAVALSLRSNEEAGRYRRDARRAASAIKHYLGAKRPGLWWDKLSPDGRFTMEPSPASSLYHLIAAISELQAYASPTGEGRR